MTAGPAQVAHVRGLVLQGPCLDWRPQCAVPPLTTKGTREGGRRMPRPGHVGRGKPLAQEGGKAGGHGRRGLPRTVFMGRQWTGMGGPRPTSPVPALLRS